MSRVTEGDEANRHLSTTDSRPFVLTTSLGLRNCLAQVCSSHCQQMGAPALPHVTDPQGAPRAQGGVSRPKALHVPSGTEFGVLGFSGIHVGEGGGG